MVGRWFDFDMIWGGVVRCCKGVELFLGWVKHWRLFMMGYMMSMGLG